MNRPLVFFCSILLMYYERPKSMRLLYIFESVVVLDDQFALLLLEGHTG
jgi:hypothetical protein